MIDIESRESSSPAVTRTLAAALLGRHRNVYEFDSIQRIGLQLLSYFPKSAAMRVLPPIQARFAQKASKIRNIRTADLVTARLRDYQELPGRFRTITMGVAMGGATGHLAAALGGPFLPQAFVTTVKGGARDGNAYDYFRRSHAIALDIADQNPDLLTIQHYDPVHDGWLTRYVNHIRLKLIKLPEEYKQYIRDTLEPGGGIAFLEGKADWLRYHVGPRSVFQVGGWGDIPAAEYLESSQRIQDYCQKIGLVDSNWAIERYPLETGAESEWGTEPGLAEDVEEFCKTEGYSIERIAFDDPNDFSRLAYLAYLRLLETEGQAPQGVLVETFSQYDILAPLQSGLLPLWLIFNTTDSLEFLKSMLGKFSQNVPIFFSPLSTFSETPDMVKFVEWAGCMSGLNWINIGARESHYPADIRTLMNWNQPLRDWCENHPYPIRARITSSELAQLARQLPESKKT